MRTSSFPFCSKQRFFCPLFWWFASVIILLISRRGAETTFLLLLLFLPIPFCAMCLDRVNNWRTFTFLFWRALLLFISGQLRLVRNLLQSNARVCFYRVCWRVWANFVNWFLFVFAFLLKRWRQRRRGNCAIQRKLVSLIISGLNFVQCVKEDNVIRSIVLILMLQVLR